MTVINCNIKIGDANASFPFELKLENQNHFVLLKTDKEKEPIKVPLDESRIVKISEKPEVYAYKGILFEIHPEQK